MERLRWRRWCRAAVFMAAVVLFNSSCKEEEPPVLPDYAGTWVTVDIIPIENGHTQMKSILTLTADSFSDLGQIQLVTDKWTDLISREGSLEVYKNRMIVHITEVGLSSYSMVTGKPTGVITSYKKGSSEFESLMYQLGLAIRLESIFTVSGNKLTIQNDENFDGDYLDEMETSVYTRQ